MGITITLDTGTVLELGTIGPVKQDIQYLGGPIHGVKWTYNEVLTSVQLGYNSCYCDMIVTAPSSTIRLGVEEVVTITSESRLGNIYDASMDACLSPTHEISGTSDVVTINSDSLPLIYSVDGSIVDDTQTVTIIQLTGSATTDYGALTEDISWSFTPGCVASSITSSLGSPEFLVTIDTVLEFDVSSSDFSYTYKDDWSDLGYADGCTISFSLEGSAADFTTTDGTTVSIAPVSGTTTGSHDLNIVAYYSASTYGETTPLASPTKTVSMTVIAERAVEIELWPM